MSGSEKSRKKTYIITASIAVFLLLGSMLVWLLFARSNTDSSPFPKSVTSSVDFPLYYPNPVPPGYTLDKKSIGGNHNAIFYELSNTAKNLKLTITMQAVPSGFDAAKIVGSSPIPTTITSSGTLYNLSIGGATKYMLVGDKTLLFITSSHVIPIKDVNNIANSLVNH